MISDTIDTPLGPMKAMADDKGLCLLTFCDQLATTRKDQKIISSLNEATPETTTKFLAQIKQELHAYFSGQLTTFKTPLHLMGTAFQQSVWRELQKIPYGQTCAYADIARALGKPTAYRAVANANGANPLGVIVPCHRVISSDGSIGGYTGGIRLKRQLLALEMGRTFS
jgi:AraC family transcriptional regulator, regulatory protein of adaptative response / methylated-DNA-[protein]-cysteine methyltransferase